jgi:type VI secretion system protein ImpB
MAGTQSKIGRVRPPRVQIEYAVETGGAIEKKEIPFVMAVLADFSGNPKEQLVQLKDRKFVDVSPDNFDEVLAKMKPRLQFAVDNKLSKEPNAGRIGVELNFKSLDDFAPDAVVHQVPKLEELLAFRTKLADLRGALQGNEKLEDILQKTVGNDEMMQKLKAELGLGGENG